MTDVSPRLAWHTFEAESRDIRFAGWNGKKAEVARAAVTQEQLIDAFLAIRAESPNLPAPDARTRAEILASGWATCDCGRVFQPRPLGPDGKPRSAHPYTSCFHCNQHASASGTLTCVMCGRRHKASFGACFQCKTAGREDQARFIRNVVLVRDRFTCQMCGKDGRDIETSTNEDEELVEGVALQVDHIDPDGSAWWWNIQTLCTPCDLIKGKQYGIWDEAAKLDLMMAYRTYLWEFLDATEREVLTSQFHETLGFDMSAKPPLPDENHPIEGRRYGTCDEIEGMVNVLNGFGRDGIEVSHQ